MIWDNFSIFRTNFAFLTSYIGADPRTCRGFSRGCCHVAWSNCEELWDSLADFSQRWQGIRLAIRYRALICSFMLWANGKGEFFRVENKTSISRCEWIKSARARWTRKLLSLSCKEKLWKKTLYSSIKLIWEFPKQCLIITKTSNCFCLFGEVCRSFWVAHLHSAARAVSSPSPCFQL